MTDVGTEVVYLNGYDGLVAAIGSELGVSPWFTIEQNRIDSFAETTGDHAWIHVDTERAADGPFGSTIAHGLLTLSLVTMLAARVVRVNGLRSALHYGYDQVRFIRPVTVESRIRARVTLSGVDGAGAKVRARYQVEVEIENAQTPGPVCVADLIYFYSFEPAGQS
jgi:acyl dehydratase